MDNASGFTDYSTLLGLNAEDESKLLEQALQQARDADNAARGALRKSEREAGGHYNTDPNAGPIGQIVGDSGDITTTGSYTDYLDAKTKAAAAWAKLRNSTRDPFRQGVTTQGIQDEMGGADAAIQAREDAAAGRVKTTSDSYGRMRGEQAERERLAKEAADKRAGDDAASKAAYIQSLKDKAAKYWAAQDKDRAINANPFRTHGQNTLYAEGVGPKYAGQVWNPQTNSMDTTPVDPSSDGYYTSGWGTTSDADLLTQQLNAAVATGEADKFNAPATYEGGKRTKGGW